jgi:HAE1 family hydrophobic/amphiphilic exporter-1/multidrug efflux pump
VSIFGQKRPSMRIWIDPNKLNAFNLTYSDFRTALNRENVEIPSGKLYGNKTEMTIRALGKLQTEDDFKNLIIVQNEAGIIRLKDIAKVEIGPEQEEYSWKLNGINGVGVIISPQPGANYIKIADEFYKRVEDIKKNEKGDFEFTPLIDQTKNVRRAIKEVEETLLISFTLVVLVIFFFFRNWLIAIRPIIDIPISLIATFFVMYIFGFSINVLTLLGIVLATGLVVDDGIVVTENIFRKLELGLPIRRAALEGSKEIFFAVISTSITLAVVFLPVIFLQGFVGSLFREFGITVAAAVLISAFVSLTITPVLNVLLTKKGAGHGKFYEQTEPFFKGMENGYKRLLAAFVRVRWIAWVIVVACLGTIYFVGTNLPSELAPLEDRSSIRFQMTGPEGASFNYMSDVAGGLTDYLSDSIPEKSFVFASIPGFSGNGGVNGGTARIALVDPENRKRSQSDIVKAVTKKLSQFNNARIFPVEEQTISVGLGSRGALPVQLILQNLEFEKIKAIIPKFLEEARKDKTFQNVDVNLKFSKPELQLTIDRIKAKDLGLSISDVADVVSSAFSGRRLAYFTMKGKQYDVISQVSLKDRQTPSDILSLYVRNNRGEMIPLSAVVDLKESSNPPTLYHYNRFRSATISASLAEGKTIGDGVKAMDEISKRLLDESFHTAYGGPSRDFKESSSNTTFAFLLALLLIYLV